jgi:hypothetical protein
VDGQVLTVGENLYAALKVLQHSRTIQYLWVDAICINQTDLAERNQQVGMMNAIYRCAERVVVWLGSEAEESDFAIDTIRSWSKEIPKHAFSSDKAYWERVASIKPSDPMFCGPPGTDGHRAWLAIRNLWERRWWRRAWIVQEAMLSAPQRLELLCGNKSIYWDDFAVSIDIAQCLGRHEGFQTFENWNQVFPTRLHAFRVERESGYYLRLLKVLEEMRSYECGDDRDKVFAALGMAADVNLDDFTPDYNKSVGEVYTDVVRFMLGASELHSFDFLGYIVRPEGLDPDSKMGTRYKDLPTWVCIFSIFLIPAFEYVRSFLWSRSGSLEMFSGFLNIKALPTFQVSHKLWNIRLAMLNKADQRLFRCLTGEPESPTLRSTSIETPTTLTVVDYSVPAEKREHRPRSMDISCLSMASVSMLYSQFTPYAT